METNKFFLLTWLLFNATLLIPATAAIPTTAHAALPAQQLENIIGALIGSGDFGNWGHFLSTTDPSMFPLSATIFLPEISFPSSSSAASSVSLPVVDPLSYGYHIVPQRLSFSELTMFPVNSRLPTLIIDRSIVITDDSPTNYTLNNKSRLTRPDVFSTPTIVVHGIADALDYHSIIHGSESGSTGERNLPHNPQSPPPRARGEQENVTDLEEAESPIGTQHPEVSLASSRSTAYVVVFILPVLWSVLGLIKIFQGKRST